MKNFVVSALLMINFVSHCAELQVPEISINESIFRTDLTVASTLKNAYILKTCLDSIAEKSSKFLDAATDIADSEDGRDLVECKHKIVEFRDRLVEAFCRQNPRFYRWIMKLPRKVGAAAAEKICNEINECMARVEKYYCASQLILKVAEEGDVGSFVEVAQLAPLTTARGPTFCDALCRFAAIISAGVLSGWIFICLTGASF